MIIRSELARCQPASFRKKLFPTSSRYFVFILSKRIKITSSKEALKVCEHIKSSITYNLPVQLRYI